MQRKLELKCELYGENFIFFFVDWRKIKVKKRLKGCMLNVWEVAVFHVWTDYFCMLLLSCTCTQLGLEVHTLSLFQVAFETFFPNVTKSFLKVKTHSYFLLAFNTVIISIVGQWAAILEKLEVWCLDQNNAIMHMKRQWTSLNSSAEFFWVGPGVGNRTSRISHALCCIMDWGFVLYQLSYSC